MKKNIEYQTWVKIMLHEEDILVFTAKYSEPPKNDAPLHFTTAFNF